ncbi:MFS transporter [Nocardia sp. NPDC005998]|uniref:MFS transporter n=1 Tax=Nocardia sp. NPDC005998 TaxID=3156894 RepID=UPI0033BF4DAD
MRARLTGRTDEYGIRGLTVRAVLFKGIGELIPLYALYAVLFADHGLSTGQISSLLAIWSATAFLLEVPSGAWADTVSRRGLLVSSGVLLTAGFTLWTVLPTYLGFALGFLLWGTSGALVSGTFEALLYDELVAHGARQAYPQLIGYARAASEAAIVIAIVAATPLYVWGGYPLLGWSSVLFAAVHTLIALSLPSAPKAVSAAAVEELEDDAVAGDSSSGQQPAGGTRVAADVTAAARRARVLGPAGQSDEDGSINSSIARQRADSADPATSIGPVARKSTLPRLIPTEHEGCDDRAPAAAGGTATSDCDESVSRPFVTYLSMLRTGVGEAIRVRAVRNGVMLGALLFGITAFDEYFALLAAEVGVATAIVPLLVGITVLGSLIGSVLAGRTEAISARTMARAVGIAGVLFVGGALISGLAVRWPAAVYVLAVLGFTAIGASYGIIYNATVVAGARLQDAIEGPARATVTSVSGLASEVVALAVFGFTAVATLWFSMSTTVALLGTLLLAIALLTPSWLPQRPN